MIIFSPPYAAGTSGSNCGIDDTPGSGVTGSGGSGGSGVIGGSGSKLTGGSVGGGSTSLLLGSPLLTPGDTDGLGSTLGEALGDGDTLGPVEGEAEGDADTALPAMWSDPPLHVRGILSGEYHPTAVS